MRKKIVAGNWKMNKNYQDGLALVSEIDNMLTDEVGGGGVEVVVAPPYPYLQSVGKLLQANPMLHLAAQNCHHKDSGAFTGEVSAAMLQSVGCTYVILGHSERRQYFREDNQLLEQKVKAAINQGLIPIFCCGESLEEREQANHFKVIAEQLKEGLFHLSNEDFAQAVIAYEPVWAIGTGKTASSEQAQEVHAYIREQIARHYDAEAAVNTTILYGGSCNPGNARELFSQPDVDGGLIGGASLKARDFVDIVKAF
ncbi:triose-phosphate isomerase [soil metagenome]